MKPPIRVRCAGWSLSAAVKDRFPGEGTHLERYARQLLAVEINSSFYRPHRRSTYERWAESVPRAFAFSVKVPRRITHELRLTKVESEFLTFLEQVSGLGEKLGCLLVQLPPSLRFDASSVESFLSSLRAA